MNRTMLMSIVISLIVGFLLGNFTSSPRQNLPPPEKIVFKDKECPQDLADAILPPPLLSSKLNLPLLSNQLGEVRVTWNEVPHATRYRVQVLNHEGKTIKDHRTTRLTLYLKELPYDDAAPFTPYSVVLSTLNRKDEEGAPSPRYDLRVRPLKNLMAPSIKEIIVEN